MYAVIRTGGKQHRVEEGQTLDIELIGDDEKVTLKPVLLVDGDTVLAKPSELAKASVTAKIVGESKGPKLNGFNYKNKSNNRKRWCHRQQYTTIEITGISKG